MRLATSAKLLKYPKYSKVITLYRCTEIQLCCCLYVNISFAAYLLFNVSDIFCFVFLEGVCPKLATTSVVKLYSGFKTSI